MYNVITKGQENGTKSFNDFKSAINYLKSEVEDWGRYFTTEKVSDVFYKIWYRRDMYPFGLQYTGCIYLKKVA